MGRASAQRCKPRARGTISTSLWRCSLRRGSVPWIGGRRCRASGGRDGRSRQCRGIRPERLQGQIGVPVHQLLGDVDGRREGWRRDDESQPENRRRGPWPTRAVPGAHGHCHAHWELVRGRDIDQTSRILSGSWSTRSPSLSRRTQLTRVPSTAKVRSAMP